MTAINVTSVPYDEFFTLLEKNHLLPDFYREFPEAAMVLHQGRVFFEILKDDDRIGLIWLDGRLEVDWPFGANIGVVVDRNHRGTWFDEDLVDELLKVIFDKMQIPRLTAIFHNQRSRAEYFFKKLGFSYEGTIPSYASVMGRRIKHIQLGLTKEDYHGPVDRTDDSEQRNKPGWEPVRREEEAAAV